MKAFFPDASESRALLETSAAKSMSAAQRTFLAGSGFATARIGKFGENLKGHWHGLLYANTVEDAEKMVEAAIEYSLQKKAENHKLCLAQLAKFRERVKEGKERIPQIEAEISATVEQLEACKKECQFSSAKEAEQILPELNKVLSLLRIEIAGIETRLRLVEKYLGKYSRRAQMNEISDRLQQMQVELVIELEGAKAKQVTANALREGSQRFCELDIRHQGLNNEMTNVLRRVGDSEGAVEGYEQELERQSRDRSPEVYANQVNIYRVGTQD